MLSCHGNEFIIHNFEKSLRSKVGGFKLLNDWTFFLGASANFPFSYLLYILHKQSNVICCIVGLGENKEPKIDQIFSSLKSKWPFLKSAGSQLRNFLLFRIWLISPIFFFFLFSLWNGDIILFESFKFSCKLTYSCLKELCMKALNKKSFLDWIRWLYSYVWFHAFMQIPFCLSIHLHMMSKRKFRKSLKPTAS